MKTKKNFIQNTILSTIALITFGLLSADAIGATINANYNSATDVPVTANGYTATGSTIIFTLKFGPATGTELMVVKNTGLGFINGAFDNLTNGQAVTLSYGGTNYMFVANYYGGTGNDLVLAWANNRIFAWGYNYSGQLGDNRVSGFQSFVPEPVTATGVLAGKAVVGIAAGYAHSLALCSDGTVAAWGYNSDGRLGDATSTERDMPVAVSTASGASVLYGKKVVAIAAGATHSLALCSDGTVAAWGYNGDGELGDNNVSGTGSPVPVAVNTSSGISALYGKTVVAIAAGGSHSLALCGDGTLVAWGRNSEGELGDNTTTDRNVPVAVNTVSAVSALSGKTVVAIAAGVSDSLALCSDGTVAAWGSNSDGELGDNTATGRDVPVVVNTDSGVSALYAKTPVAVAAGGGQSMALCSDGTATAWGYNGDGRLGDNTTTDRFAPVEVNAAAGVSALYGKTLAALAAGLDHSVALCSDGSIAAWGRNDVGQLGDKSASGFQSPVPVAVSTTPLSAGERFTRISVGSVALHTLALVASPPAPKMNLTGNGLSIATGEATPSIVDGTDFGSAPVGGGTVVRTFTIQNMGTAPLNLTGAPRVVLTGPQAADFRVTVQPNSPVASSDGKAAFQVTFAPSAPRLRTAAVIITNDDSGQTPYVFSIQGTGGGILDAIYNSATDVPVTTSGYTATGSTVNFTLNYAPVTGTDLMVVKNTGPSFINGSFENLTNGQPVALSYGGVSYNFVASYYGGSGNDLVLFWANNRPLAWGGNGAGQLGDDSTTTRLAPVAVNTSLGLSALYGKSVLCMVAGGEHSLALCSDGTVAAWGLGGALGDNTWTYRYVPVAVNTAPGISALYGKTVVAVQAGDGHNLALCSDGTVVAWGSNTDGQLGDNTGNWRIAPVAVNTTAGVSALYGKTVVAIAAGGQQSLALCSDGTVAAWGRNSGGQLGDNTTTERYAPVAVNAASGVSALYGKTVVAIAMSAGQSLALCSDGSLAAWGYNYDGELGDNTTTQRTAPVAVNRNSGVSALYGKTVVAIAAGNAHSLALCSDGTLAAWGLNDSGQLGDGTTANRLVPVAVSTNSGVSVLYGKTPLAIAAGPFCSFSLCSDSTIAAWGANGSGQLGDGTTTNHPAPVAVSAASVAAGQRFTRVGSGSSQYVSHTLGLVAAPPTPAMNLTANNVTITNGDTTPALGDGTDFGAALVGGGPVVRIFTIQNMGTAPLNLTGAPRVVLTGPQAADFTVAPQPASPVANSGGTSTFQVTFAPSTSGLRTATLSITNDDTANNPYVFTVQGTGTSTPLPATVTYSNLLQIYDGTAKPVSVTTIPPGLAVDLTYNGSPNPPTNVGSYTVSGTISNPNYQGGTTDTLIIAQAPATVTLGNLWQAYDGTAKPVSVTTTPPGLLVSVTYDGSSNAPTNVGTYTIIAIVNDLSYQGGATNALAITGATTHYVNLNNPVPVAPYASWVTAATNIQDAIDVAAASDEIIVTNGVYQTGGRVVYGTSNRVAVIKALKVRSASGPTVTSIVGYRVPSTTNGPAAVRCVYLTNGALLAGFTLANGATQTSGDLTTNLSGGGVWCESATAVVTNCVLTGNSASFFGGGSHSGTLNNCLLSCNSATDGGGAESSTLNKCTLSANWASSDGGGVYYGTLNNCTLRDNLASGQYGGGGGSYNATLNNCTLTGNSATGSFGGGGAMYGTLNSCTLTTNSAIGQYGGGASFSTLNNCVLAGNSASVGGGVYDGTLNNCTLTGNSAQVSGGTEVCTLNNCIIYYNSAPQSANSDDRSTLNNCCTTPLPSGGSGNIANAPLFVDQPGGNLRLQANSPCINAGNDAYAPGTTDLDGNPRIVGGAVDLGAYEFQSSTSVPPTITSQPQSQTVVAGGTATFTITATGGTPLDYQWRFNGTDISGANTNSYKLASAFTTNSGSYDVVVTNSWGRVTSTVATLTVLTGSNCVPSPAGLVAWWPADGNAVDIVGGDNGTISGSASFVSGEVGQAFSFDGNIGIVNLNGPSLNGNASYTLMFWAKPSAYIDDSALVCFGANGVTDGAICVAMWSNGTKVTVAHYGDDHIFGQSWLLNQWQQVVITYDSSTRVENLYFNGSFSESWTPNQPLALNSSRPMTFGRWAWGGQYYNGLLDEVQFFNRALGTNEILAIYNAGSAGMCKSPVPPYLTTPTRLPNGSLQFAFPNSSGALFSVLASTNPALPLSNWTVLGGVTETSPGQFQFTDPQPTNTLQRFYRVRSP